MLEPSPHEPSGQQVLMERQNGEAVVGPSLALTITFYLQKDGKKHSALNLLLSVSRPHVITT